MDKKNTMLLTVIAVATLLVAVVGATFAYFSVTSGSTTNTSSLQTTTKEVGTVTMTGGNTTFYLNPTAAQMAKSAAPSSWYSTPTNVDAVALADKQNINLATFTLAGAHSGDKYQCSFTWTLRTESESANYANLTADDASITINSGSGVYGFENNYTLLSTKYDTNASLNGQSGTGRVELTADNTGAATTDITAFAQWNNLADANAVADSGNQNNRANLSMTTTFNITGFNCDTVASFTSES